MVKIYFLKQNITPLQHIQRGNAMVPQGEYPLPEIHNTKVSQVNIGLPSTCVYISMINIWLFLNCKNFTKG